MPTFVAFLRAVNVRPRWVPMERLRKHLSDSGFTAVETHIQSGNVLLTTPMRSAAGVRDELHQLLSAEFGFDIPVVVRTKQELQTLAAEVDDLPSPLSADSRVYVALVDGRVAAAGAGGPRRLGQTGGAGARARLRGRPLAGRAGALRKADQRQDRAGRRVHGDDSRRQGDPGPGGQVGGGSRAGE